MEMPVNIYCFWFQWSWNGFRKGEGLNNTKE